MEHERLSFVRGDICHPKLEGEIVADFNVIVAAAAKSHVERSIRDADIAHVIEAVRPAHAAFTR
jgi:dTDP-glucose 4,6-dehydratase